jgi:hypothetical protein
MQALGDGLPPPTEAALGLAGVAATQAKSNLSKEEPALVAAQTPGGRWQQGVGTLAEGFQGGLLGDRRGG